ncbi:MAG: D-aminoacyl-tRNA deacylase [Sulfolobales archaeon]
MVVAYSTLDMAGRGIAMKLASAIRCQETTIKKSSEACATEIGGNEVIIAGFNEDVLYFGFLDELFEADYYVIVSRHSATSGIKSLTVHHAGNPSTKAEYGGRPRELAIANPPIAFSILKELNNLSVNRGIAGIEVTYEVTHHGPTEVKKPLTFAEIGSTIDEWSNELYQEVLAKAVYKAIAEPEPSCTPSVGIGGGHYAHQFTRRALHQGECYGHIISRHALKDLRESPELLESILRQAVTRSSIQTRKIVLEGKVPGYVRRVANSIAGDYGLDVIE